MITSTSELAVMGSNLGDVSRGKDFSGALNLNVVAVTNDSMQELGHHTTIQISEMLSARLGRTELHTIALAGSFACDLANQEPPILLPLSHSYYLGVMRAEFELAQGRNNG